MEYLKDIEYWIAPGTSSNVAGAGDWPPWRDHATRYNPRSVNLCCHYELLVIIETSPARFPSNVGLKS
jgi:hypothetical protein